MTIDTIIVEDEPLSRTFLMSLLTQYCSNIKIVATVATEEAAVAAIIQQKPQLVLMDIELQQGNGFNVLQRTRMLKYDIIFTTALDYEGIRAIRFSGVQYLPKPIDMEGLQNCICPITTQRRASSPEAIEALLHTLDNHGEPDSLCVCTANGIQYIPLRELIYVVAENNDCIFHTKHTKIKVANSSINQYDQLLQGQEYFRLHSNYIIQIKKINPAALINSGQVQMLNGTFIPVSPKKQTELEQRLLHLAAGLHSR